MQLLRDRIFTPPPGSVQQANREMDRLRHQLAQAREEIAELRSLVDRDALTGLANRRRLMTEIEGMREHCRNGGRQAVLAFIDMDNLKQLNDRHGHHVGDAAIVHVARLIRGSVTGGFAARLGGDEFSVIIPDAGLAEGQALVDALVDRIAVSPLWCEARLHPITISAGVTAIDPGATVKTLLTRADAAMYQNKRGAVQAVRSAR